MLISVTLPGKSRHRRTSRTIGRKIELSLLLSHKNSWTHWKKHDSTHPSKIHFACLDSKNCYRFSGQFILCSWNRTREWTTNQPCSWYPAIAGEFSESISMSMLVSISMVSNDHDLESKVKCLLVSSLADASRFYFPWQHSRFLQQHLPRFKK